MNWMKTCISMTCMAGGHGEEHIFKQLYATKNYAMM